ncbi:MAG: alpha/beta hydrolase [Opitutaceae bacterium]|nr:alpha/beta hydrolase [Opitutaceae bacterium]
MLLPSPRPSSHRPFLSRVVVGIAATFAGLTHAIPLAAAPETITYKKVGEQELRLQVDKPPGWSAGDRRPAIVFYFGGGWVGGSPEQFRKQSEHLAARGMVGVRVQYRVIPKGDAGPPLVCCADAKSALRYVRAHAAQLGIDPNRIAAAGGSAGGHLAAFATLVPGLDDPQDDMNVSPRGNALVLFNPVFNNGPGEWGHARVGARYREFSPAHHVTKDAPPTIVFLGDKDNLIPVRVLHEFKAAMDRAGVRCEARVYPGATHGFFNKDQPGQPWFTETLAEADRFLTSLGWLTPPAPPPPAR